MAINQIKARTFTGTAAERAAMVGLRGGDVFEETDTSKTYVYNADGATWIEITTALDHDRSHDHSNAGDGQALAPTTISATGNVSVTKITPQLTLTDANGRGSGLKKNETSDEAVLYDNVYKPVGAGNCLDFDGSNEYVHMGNNFAFEYTTPFSLEAWIYCDDTVSAHNIIGKMNGSFVGYELRVGASSFLFFGLYQDASHYLYIYRPFSTTGSWVHIIATYDGSNTVAGLKTYVNTVEDHTISLNQPLNASIVTAANFDVGARQDGGNPFDGKIDMPRVFNKVLSQTEVNILNNSGAGIVGGDPLGDSSCIGAWAFDESTGSNAADSSTGGHNGTCVNMENSDWVIGKVWLVGTYNDENAISIEDGVVAGEGAIVHLGDKTKDDGSLIIHNIPSKTTPIDADSVIQIDSADSNKTKRSTWTQIKAFLKTYFDTIYQAVGSYLSNLVEDTTPQLGGDLDLNGKNIDFPTTPNISDCLDEDDMASNSATKLATQQSIKAYADTKASASLLDKTIYNELIIAVQHAIAATSQNMQVLRDGKFTRFNSITDDILSSVGCGYSAGSKYWAAITADLLLEEFPSLAAWTASGTGTAEISPAGELRLLPSAGSYKRVLQDIGALPEAGYTFTFPAYYDALGTVASEDLFDYQFYDGVHNIVLRGGTDYIRCYNSAGGWTDFTVATSAGVQYYWQFKINSSGHSFGVYRSTNPVIQAADLITTFTSFAHDATLEGTVMITHMRYGAPGGEAHYKSIYGYTGLYTPPDPSPGTGTLVGNDLTVSAVPTTLYLVAVAIDADDDIVWSVTRDGRTTYSTVTMTDIGNLVNIASSSIYIGKVDVSGQPSGSTVGWKVVMVDTADQVYAVAIFAI